MDKFHLSIVILLLLLAYALVPSAIAEEEIDVPWEINCYDRNPYNGFINDVGICIPGVITDEAWYAKSPSRFWGVGDSYAPGVMERVCDYRGGCGGYKGGVAVMSCGDIGRTAWLKRPDQPWDGPFLVVDCSHKRHMFHNVNIGLVVEWGYKTTERWGQSVVSNVIVHLGGKPNDSDWGWYYRTWWMEYALDWEQIDIRSSSVYIARRGVLRSLLALRAQAIRQFFSLAQP